MKSKKKFVSLLLALIMVLAMNVPVFAENTHSHTITITYKNAGHTYAAYQVFSGDITDKKLTNIEWGAGVDSSAILAKLQALTDSPYASCTDAKDVAEILAKFEDDSKELDTFANIVGEHLSTTKAGTSSEYRPLAGTSSTYSIPVTGDGYYFVKDITENISEGSAATKYILKVVEDVTVNAKADAPSLEKKIVDSNMETSYNNAAIGDTVNFKVTSRVPDMDGYQKYFFIVNDTMSKGLTFNDDVAIKIGKTPLIKERYTVSYETDETTKQTSIKIVFKNFIQYKDQKNESITITYSAAVNEDAVIGTTGNPNTAFLTYSNDPTITDDSTSDEPTQPTGKTPESKTITYVTGLKLLKVDKDNKTLANAEFEITGEKLNTVLVTGWKFVESEDGTYYLLKDGTYTEEVPDSDENEDYVSTTQKYKPQTVSETITKSTEEVEYRATTDDNGVLEFKGLSAGNYTIEEIKAPDGYHKLETPLYITIDWAAPTAPSTNCTWSVAGTDSKKAAVTDDGIVQLTVENRAGSTLPSTGGMGTTIFYILGSLLVVGAAILLIVKKCMGVKK